jgi:membrane-bound serine protease (ClpP class)
MVLDNWVWSVVLLALGAGLVVLEVFFPSAGILGFLAACAILGSIIFGFKQGALFGFAVLAVAIVGLPALLVLAFKYWPRTAMGRRVLLLSPSSEDVLPVDPEKELLKNHIGKVAVAKCKMLPGGAITLEGRTIDAVSEGMPVAAGQKVRIIEVRGNRVVVRPLDEEELQETAEDPLRRPIDSVIADPFEEERRAGE